MIGTEFSKSFIESNYLLIAAGVSNSQETDPSVFARDTRNIESIVVKHFDKKIFYISSCQNEDINFQTPYFLHKRLLEKILLEKHKNTMILRLPQVVGINNNMTLFPTLVRKMYLSESLNIQKNTKRVLIDVADVVRIVQTIITKKFFESGIFNITPSYSVNVEDLVALIKEQITSHSEIKIVGPGRSAFVDDKYLHKLVSQDDILLDRLYASLLVNKYVPQIIEQFSKDWKEQL